MKRIALLLALFLLLPGGTAIAAHITDKLVVGIYADSKLEGEPLQLLTSGTPVEVLKQGKRVVKVRLADDTRGWVETRYVSEEKPAAMKLLEVQAELRGLRSRLAAGEGNSEAGGEPALPSVEKIHAGLALNEARTRIAELEQQLADLPRLQAAASERDELRARIDQVRELLGVDAGSQALPSEQPSFWERNLGWLLTALAALLGFFAGIALVEYRIRKRYGGLRL